ncbi:polymorphic toxin-type HINT domain-containing protein [Rhizobium beringeri]
MWSRDEQGHEGYKLALAKIQENHTETVYLTLKSDRSGRPQTIITTTNHPFFAVVSEERTVPVALPEGHRYKGAIKNGSWVAAADLRPGERLFDSDGSWSSVVNVRVRDKQLNAYNLTIADFHTYFVKQADNDNAQPVWVHNACGPDINRFIQKSTKDRASDLFEAAQSQFDVLAKGESVGTNGGSIIASSLKGVSQEEIQFAYDLGDLRKQGCHSRWL